MKEYIAFDSHKHYTLMEREAVESGRVVQRRIEHRIGAIREALAGCQPGATVAVEAMGSWYWIVQEIEQAGLVPALVHPRKAKLMMGMINKTDKLDVHGLNRLQRNGTLPTVWIAPADLRDLREVTRTRMVLKNKGVRNLLWPAAWFRGLLNALQCLRAVSQACFCVRSGNRCGWRGPWGVR